MAKSITLNYKDAQYVLEFTKDTVLRMEEAGFNIRDIRAKPMTVLPTLFKGAFLAHCSYLKENVLDEIFESLEDKKGMFDRLIELYNDPVEKLLEEPEPSEKNATWEANW